jgi:dolichol-phosphate hexosyltransferase
VKLSVLMPVYNEAVTLREAVKSVLEVDYPCDMELVVVDDGSADQTWEILSGLEGERMVRCRHSSNRGKGAAIRTAAQAATGDYIVRGPRGTSLSLWGCAVGSPCGGSFGTT